MSGDDECEEWCGWLDIPPKRVVRVRAVVTSVVRPCASCGAMVPEREFPPYADHAPDCAIVAEWGRVVLPPERDEARALLAEGKRIATEKRNAREARERDPERAR